MLWALYLPTCQEQTFSFAASEELRRCRMGFVYRYKRSGRAWPKGLEGRVLAQRVILRITRLPNDIDN